MIAPEKPTAAKRCLFCGIVARLRLLLFVVGLVTVAACFIGFKQLREISDAHQALTQDALPIMIRTQAVERDHSAMFLSLERVTMAANADDLARAENQLLQGIRRFRSHVVEVDKARGPSELTGGLIARLNELEIAVDRLLAQQRTLLVNETQLNALESNLNKIRAAAREALQNLNFDMTVKIETLLSKARSGDAPPADVIDQLFSDLFLASLNLNSLSIDIKAVIDLARFDQRVQTTEAFKASRATLESKLRRVAALLSQIDSSPERTELAGLTIQLNTLLLGRQGLIEIGEARLSHREKLLALQQVRIEMARDMALLVDQLSVQSTASVEEKSQLLKDAIQFLSLMLGISMFLAGTTTLVGNSIIIEKQINRRMGRLEQAVKAIAGGDLDHPIDVDGRDELGDIARALSVFKHNAEELRRSNVDLERFAYVAAHDLRSPLRAVHDLAEWTMEDEENALSEDSRGYLEIMQSRVKRLDRLLADLLDYARAGHENDGLMALNMAQTIDQTSQMLDPSDSFNISYVGPKLTFRTYTTPLNQILTNLISNAIKHHDCGTGRIIVSAAVKGDRVVVEVADDGPGIPKEYQQRIFQLFQTLRPRDEVEGSGLGLAIIRKLLDRYKGDIELESNPEIERGARFIFDFPIEEVLKRSDHLQADAA